MPRPYEVPLAQPFSLPAAPTLAPTPPSSFVLDLVWICFFIALVVFVGYGIILIYHWFTYGENRAIAVSATTLYLGAGGVLFLIMLGAAVTMSL